MFDEGGSRVMLRKVLVGAPARRILSVLPWLVLSGALFGQGNSGSAPGGGPANNDKRLALPQDWSDHNVVFSTPANSEKASQLSHDPRYLKQYLGRNLAGTRNVNVANPAAGNGGIGTGQKNPPPAPPGTPQGDWNYSLGGSSSAHVAANMFPAKYNFNINQAPSCTDDFVVFAENVTGFQAVKASRTGTFTGSNENGTTVTVAGTAPLTASGGTAASKGGTFTANVRNSGSVTITNGANVLTLTPNPTGKTIDGTFSGGTATSSGSVTITVGSNSLVLTSQSSGTNGCTSSTAGTFVGNASLTISARATALRDAVNSCNSSFATVGATATVSGGITTVSATTPGSDITFTQVDSLSNFGWANAGGGSNGSNTCSSSTSGTFAISTTNSTQASNLATAISACPVAAGVTASSSSSTTTVTARINGTAGNSISLGNTLTGFSW